MIKTGCSFLSVSESNIPAIDLYCQGEVRLLKKTHADSQVHFFFNALDRDKVVLDFSKPNITVLSCHIYNIVIEFF